MRMVGKSGNRTIRVILERPVDGVGTRDETLEGLVALGCSYEGADGSYLAINIPPGIELGTIRDYLTECGATWEHAEYVLRRSYSRKPIKFL